MSLVQNVSWDVSLSNRIWTQSDVFFNLFQLSQQSLLTVELIMIVTQCMLVLEKFARIHVGSVILVSLDKNVLFKIHYPFEQWLAFVLMASTLAITESVFKVFSKYVLFFLRIRKQCKNKTDCTFKFGYQSFIKTSIQLNNFLKESKCICEFLHLKIYTIILVKKVS